MIGPWKGLSRAMERRSAGVAADVSSDDGGDLIARGCVSRYEEGSYEGQHEKAQ